MRRKKTERQIDKQFKLNWYKRTKKKGKRQKEKSKKRKRKKENETNQVQRK